MRVAASFDDWGALLTAALAREDDRGNRFVLRQAQVCAMRSSADPAIVDELAATFNGDERFFEAVHLLTPEREVAAMLKAFDLATDADVVRVLAERLLRIVFEDQRTGWGGTSHSLLREDGTPPPQVDIGKAAIRAILKMILWKVFPFALRRRLRKGAQSKVRGIRKIDYWGLEGAAPGLPATLSATQRNVLEVFAAKVKLWGFQTNLWQLFGLPDTPDELHRLLARS